MKVIRLLHVTCYINHLENINIQGLLAILNYFTNSFMCSAYRISGAALGAWTLAQNNTKDECSTLAQIKC
jgi:hypothetical protein